MVAKRSSGHSALIWRVGVAVVVLSMALLSRSSAWEEPVDAAPPSAANLVGLRDSVGAVMEDSTDAAEVAAWRDSVGAVIADSASGSSVSVTDTMAAGVTGYVKSLADNKGFYTGAGNDLRIYHDGTSSWVKDASNPLLLQGGNYSFQIGGSHGFSGSPTMSGTSNSAIYLTPSFAPSGASNDVGLALHPNITGSNAGALKAFYQYAAISSGVTLATLYHTYIQNAAGAGSISGSQYGIWIEDLTKGSSGNWGIYSNADILFNKGVFIGSTGNSQQIDDASHGSSSGTLYIGNASINVTSDVRAKLNWRPYKGSPLEVLGHAKLGQFEYDPEKIGDTGHGPASRGTYLGFTAQDMYEWAPWAVNTQGTEMDSVAFAAAKAGEPTPEHPDMWKVEYEHLVPVTIAGLLELENVVDSLRSVVSDQSVEIGALKLGR